MMMMRYKARHETDYENGVEILSSGKETKGAFIRPAGIRSLWNDPDGSSV